MATIKVWFVDFHDVNKCIDVTTNILTPLGAEGCETRWGSHIQSWYDRCHTAMSGQSTSLEGLWGSDAVRRNTTAEVFQNCTTDHDLDRFADLNKTDLFVPHFHKRVFVIAALWDYNYHHFIADSLARLVRNLRFLRANRDVVIHIRAVENYDTNPIKSVGFKSGGFSVGYSVDCYRFLYNFMLVSAAKKMRDSLVTLLGKMLHTLASLSFFLY